MAKTLLEEKKREQTPLPRFSSPVTSLSRLSNEADEVNPCPSTTDNKHPRCCQNAARSASQNAKQPLLKSVSPWVNSRDANRLRAAKLVGPVRGLQKKKRSKPASLFGKRYQQQNELALWTPESSATQRPSQMIWEHKTKRRGASRSVPHTEWVLVCCRFSCPAGSVKPSWSRG